PVVAALQTMRGMALVNAATLIVELGRPLALRQSAPADGLSRAGAIGAFQRCERQTRRPHQGRQQRGPPAPDRGSLDLPLPGPDQPRVAAPTGGAAPADPRDRLESPAAAVRPLSQARSGKPANVVTAAIARELAGFIWAIARRVPPA